MSQIKCRAWDRKLKRMYDAQALGTMPADTSAIPYAEGTGYTYMLSTDTFDKDRKEIYENDIFSSLKGNWIVKKGAWRFWDGRVLVRMYGWYAECLLVEGNSHHQLPLHPLGMKIIGNLYENPELLGV